MGQSASARENTSNDPIELLKQLKTQVYHDSLDELALGLGRPTDEIQRWMDGDESIDEDAEFKIRGLSDERLGSDESPEAFDPARNTEQRI